MGRREQKGKRKDPSPGKGLSNKKPRLEAPSDPLLIDPDGEEFTVDIGTEVGDIMKSYP